MKIVFFALAAYPYVSDFGYQENELAKVAVRHGDEVIVVSTNYVMPFLKDYIHATPDFLKEDYIDQYGVRIIRVKYKYPMLGEKVNLRIRAYSGIKEILEEENPDMIFVHDLQLWSLFDIAAYLRRHPDCVGMGDLHATYKNGCRTWLSKNVQHRIFYRYIIQKNIDAFKKIFYLTKDALYFFETEYNVRLPKEKVAFLPIGGTVAEPSLKSDAKKRILEELELDSDSILVLHSGKLEREKRTVDLLKAFQQISNSKLHLIIIGRIPNDYQNELTSQINMDERVHFIGWKSADELQNYMLGVDLYAQPGTESASVNSAICCGCPIMLSPQEQMCGGYRSYLDENKVFFVESINDMVTVLKKIIEMPNLLEQYRQFSFEYAYNLLSYDKQIEMIKDVYIKEIE